MKLRRLDLENFRQFYGAQGLSFSTDPHKNVTLIYGSNGAGKTTILNAFTWGLYGETTPGLAESEWLISNLAWGEAKTGDSVTARVKIEFENEDRIYELERVQTGRKRADGAPEWLSNGAATLRVTNSAGQNEQVHNLEGAIGSILPKRLHRFAFFDGERDIEYLARPEATAQIEDAIKTVLGLEIMERAIWHIKKARTSELTSELSEVGDERDSELSRRMKTLEEDKEQIDGELAELRLNLAATDKELTRVDAALTKINAAQELQERRKEIEAALETVGERIDGADGGIDEALRRSGYLAFTRELTSAADERSKTLQARGEIPAPMRKPFVQQLLDEAQCICGTSLKEGSPEQEAVMAWFAKAGLPDVETRWGQLGAHAVNFQGRRDDLYRYLAETLKERSASERERKTWEQKASEIEDEMTAVDDQEAREMNEKRRTLRSQFETYNRKIGAAQLTKSQLEAEITQTERELESAKDQTTKAAKARRRVSVAREAEDICKKLLYVRTQQTREELDGRLKAVFGEMCFRPYVPTLTDDFRLTLSDMTLGVEIPVAKSTGEGQILALSFIGVMAELARKRYQESQQKSDTAGLLSFHGGVFPLALDAVFGSLDDTYQDEVAAALPDLAPQVVVLVARGSAIGAIRERLWPRTGKTAVCTLYTSKHNADDTPVEILTGPVPYRVAITESRDRSEIVEF